MNTNTRRLTPIEDPTAIMANPKLAALVELAGYKPQTLLTLGQDRALLDNVLDLLSMTIQSGDKSERSIKILVALEACRVSGCYYAAAHIAHLAHGQGVGWDKLSELPSRDASGHYSDAERKLLHFVELSLRTPTIDTAGAFAAVAGIFSERQIFDITATVATMSWLCSWNNLTRPKLEEVPEEAVQNLSWLCELGATGW